MKCREEVYAACLRFDTAVIEYDDYFKRIIYTCLFQMQNDLSKQEFRAIHGYRAIRPAILQKLQTDHLLRLFSEFLLAFFGVHSI